MRRTEYLKRLLDAGVEEDRAEVMSYDYSDLLMEVTRGRVNIADAVQRRECAEERKGQAEARLRFVQKEIARMLDAL